MKKYINCCLIVSICLIGTGCTQSRYAWNNYDQKLYNHYKNPADQDSFIKDLKSVIAKGENRGGVPPGIFAEYGYVLYESGSFENAIKYFKKEKAAWPESSLLMGKMINNSQEGLLRNTTNSLDPSHVQVTEKLL
jgi:hypothetical protein